MDIWLGRSIFFHHWKLSQGITDQIKYSKSLPISSFTFAVQYSTSSIFSSPILNSSLATVDSDSWISWVSSSIIRGFRSGNRLGFKAC
ncbi:hypothetical protein RhiirA5_428780 [Rhizophagus irregularis]|uniref:Uncharacterized protein n=1 Tax=Rhizophagus irregularis TaxID=588596 RepID=A0A2N0NZM7_9GLOM|nr:hypothetical protein RhiirA5_428780 [Rhizophagus irregularis]